MLCMLLTATVLTTVTDASASDVACVSGGRALLLAYALIADVGAAFGPLLAYGVNQFFGINAVYAVCAALFFTLFVTWRPYASGDLRS